MNQTEFSATRRLVGLNVDQFAEVMGINVRTVRRWETGATIISERAEAGILDIRAAHDLDFQSCLEVAKRGETVTFPDNDGVRPPGWWLGVAARIIDREPSAQMKWS